MNLRDREFPDRRGARREAAPRSGRAAPAFVPSTRALQPGPWNGGHRPSADVGATRHVDAHAGAAGAGRQPRDRDRPRRGARPARHAACRPARSRPRRSPAELERLDRGLDAARDAASQDETEARTRLGPQYADILAAHCRMIADPTLRATRARSSKQSTTSAEHAVLEVLERLCSRLEQLAGSHLSARAADVRDIEARILEPLDRRAPQVVSGRAGRAGDLAGARPDSQ